MPFYREPQPHHSQWGTIIDRKNVPPPPCNHLDVRAFAVAYLSSASANHPPDSELRLATATHGCPGGWRGVNTLFLSLIVPKNINL